MTSSEQQTPATLSDSQQQAQFDLGVSLSLSLWPALTLAVQNQWGGPSSADKRDWFSGAVIDLFTDRPDTDLEDVETVLLQVMLDEFEVAVDDDSAFEVAEQIMRMRRDCAKGDFAEVQSLRQRWESKRGRSETVAFQRVERNEADDETDWDSDDVEEEDEEGDVEMGDVPAPAPREKPVPEIDEDGFTKVVGKKRR